MQRFEVIMRLSFSLRLLCRLWPWGFLVASSRLSLATSLVVRGSASARAAQGSDFLCSRLQWLDRNGMFRKGLLSRDL